MTHNQTLVIDPTNWATYYGSSGREDGNGITIDKSGSVLVVGQTFSATGIATIGSHQNTFAGGSDAFIVKFSANGIRLWATYYGGTNDDNGNGITIDTSGNILVVGFTISTTGIATTGSHQTTFAGIRDGFIAKFNSNGTRLWATYYGGTNIDYISGITTDTSGNILVVGYTTSTTGIATTGSHQTTVAGFYDAFIAKFNTNGTRLWATYYGSTDYDYGYGITTDKSGNISIFGYTISTTGIATTGSHQTILAGYSDLFIAKFNTNGTRLWSTYYGGTQYEYGGGITTDKSGNILVVGSTFSTTGIATTGSHQDTLAGIRDVFFTKFNTNGTRLWATYYGGTSDDIGFGITTDTSGNILVFGQTQSTTGIATTGSHQTTFGGATDAIIAKFNTNGTRLWATYYGGTSNDYATGITTDSSGNILIVGITSSSTGIATTGSHQTAFVGNTDVFIAKFAPNGTLPIKLLSFNANLANEKVNCTWETASETNNDYFTIERSKDGNGFDAVGNVKGQGNSNRNIRYSYTDNYPFEGISYYRLKQTDFDGKYTYSDIKKVGLDKELVSKISLYYENNNPIISISSLVENKAAIELINLNGIKLFTNEQPIIKGENNFAISGNVTAGLYLLKVQMGNEVKYFKVWVR